MSLKPPPSRVLEAFKHVFHNTNDAGETFPTLGGRSARILDDEDDLMALRSPPEEDRMTRFLRNYFPLLFVVSSHLPEASHWSKVKCLQDLMLIWLLLDQNNKQPSNIYLRATSPRLRCGHQCCTRCRIAIWRDLQSLLCDADREKARYHSRVYDNVRHLRWSFNKR